MLIAISLFALVLFLIGYPLVAVLLRCPQANTQNAGNCFGLGIIATYLAGLLTPSVHWMSQMGWLLAIPGLLLAAKYATQRHKFRIDVSDACVGLTVILALVFKVLHEPLKEWDARSIWFFHAKIVYFTDHVLDAEIWHSPTVSWSHTDYPKLNAILSALWMNHFPAWNEFLPKVSLVFLWIPAVFFCIGFTESLPAQLLLMTVFMLKCGPALWNGTMDGLLAVYAGLAVLYGGRFAARRESQDFLVVVVATAICAGLKNEGLVIAMIVLSCTIIWSRSLSLRQLGSALVLFSPVVIWLFWRLKNGIVNDLGTGDWLGRGWGRLAHRILRPKEVRVAATFSIAALVLNACLSRLGFRTRWIRLAPALTAAVVYGLSLSVVYLTTPHDLNWHLDTSAGRTVQPLFAFWLSGFTSLVIARVPK